MEKIKLFKDEFIDLSLKEKLIPHAFMQIE